MRREYKFKYFPNKLMKIYSIIISKLLIDYLFEYKESSYEKKGNRYEHLLIFENKLYNIHSIVKFSTKELIRFYTQGSES